jgi:cysteine-rich repeat protein
MMTIDPFFTNCVKFHTRPSLLSNSDRTSFEPIRIHVDFGYLDGLLTPDANYPNTFFVQTCKLVAGTTKYRYMIDGKAFGLGFVDLYAGCDAEDEGNAKTFGKCSATCKAKPALGGYYYLDSQGDPCYNTCSSGEKSKTIYTSCIATRTDYFYFDDYGVPSFAPCTEMDVATPEKINYIKNTVMPAAINYFSSHLRVVPVKGKMSANNPKFETDAKACIYDFLVPDGYITTGVEADFGVFVNMRPTQGLTIAWATGCAFDQYNRPIIGVINFGPNMIDVSSRYMEDQISTAIHELFHALGFMGMMFPLFTKLDGTPHKEVLRSTSLHGNNVHMLVTPETVKKVKEQFNCYPQASDPNFFNIGAEMEDAGGGGTLGSHLEKLQFNSEVMTGSSSIIAVYSPIHLAVMQDSGWYIVNYENAPGASQPITPLSWGYQLGCDFLTKPCSQWPYLAKSFGFYCPKEEVYPSGKEYCAEDGFTHIGYCAEGYDGSLAGGATCNMYRAYSNTDCRIGSVDGNINADNPTSNPNFRCFPTTSKSNRPRCFERKCSYINGVMTQQVMINNQWLTCPKGGGKVATIPGLDGATNQDITCFPVYVACVREIGTLSSSDICGDGKRSGSEACDDGNSISGDGCSSSCAVEAEYVCIGGSETMKDTCTTKIVDACGDGFRTGSEGCDDGNAASNDGCSSLCMVEQQWECFGGSTTAKDVCTLYIPTCGDGKTIDPELCDDGNRDAGDGCSPQCEIETGFKCIFDANAADVCWKDLCGNSLRDSQYELCDDGNTISGDGCDSECKDEPNYLCSGGTDKSKDICSKIIPCGDGTLDAQEGCDDGNNSDKDGCSATCVIEPGFTCDNSKPPSVCYKGGLCGGVYACKNGSTCSIDGKCMCTAGYFGQECSKAVPTLTIPSKSKYAINALSYTLFTVVVSSNIKHLRVTVTSDDQNTAFKLLLKFGDAPKYGELGTLDDSLSISKKRNAQSIGISPHDLSPGSWYVTIVNENTENVVFTVDVESAVDNLVRDIVCVQGLLTNDQSAVTNVLAKCATGFKVKSILVADYWTQSSNSQVVVPANSCTPPVLDKSIASCHVDCRSVLQPLCVGKGSCDIISPRQTCPIVGGENLALGCLVDRPVDMVLQIECIPVSNSACQQNSCNSNGQCFTVDGFALCECSSGWTGSYCSTALDESIYVEPVTERPPSNDEPTTTLGDTLASMLTYIIIMIVVFILILVAVFVFACRSTRRLPPPTSGIYTVAPPTNNMLEMGVIAQPPAITPTNLGAL